MAGEKNINQVKVEIANQNHLKYIDVINNEIEHASAERGTGIARRTYEYLETKIKDGKAIIATDGEKFAGFCYIETWGHNRFVANSGLIVAPEYRGLGLAKKIKKKAFELSRNKFPDAKIFGLTTGLAVMKINHELGYRPVTFSELTDDEMFWKGCSGCVNYDILLRTGKSKCLCTGMLFDPEWQKKDKKGNGLISKKISLLDIVNKLKLKNGNKSKENNKIVTFLMTVVTRFF